MEAHGSKAEDFRLALRVNLSQNREHIIWAFAPAKASMLGLEQLCYLRADKKESATIRPAAPSPEAEHYTTLVQKASAGRMPESQQVRVRGRDEYAWYGYPPGEDSAGVPLVWPGGEWEHPEENTPH